MSTTTVPHLRVGEVARAARVTTDTIRYYERQGLLPAPERTPSGYRAYGPEALERLAFIQGCQRLGLRLSDIRQLLGIRDTGVCPCGQAEQHLRHRIAEVDAELERLTALRAEMSAMADSLPSQECPPPPGATWCPPDCEGGDCT